MILHTIALLVLLTLLSSGSLLRAESRLELTQQEQTFLDNLDVIHLCTDPDWMPYEGIEKGGIYQGIMSDFHQHWSQLIGVPIELQPTKSWQQTLEFMQQKRCDVLSSATATPSRDAYLSVTKPFIFYPLALATQPDNTFIINLRQVLDKPFVMVQGYAAVDIVREQYPDINIRTVKTAKEGLRRVEKGHAFAYIDTVPSINYQTLKHGISHIKINGVLDLQYSMSVGIRNDLPLLLSVYNKVITATSDSDRQDILNNWLSLSFHNEIDYSLIWKLVATAGVLFILFFYRYCIVNAHNRKLQQMNKQLEILSRSDQLTGIANRYWLHDSFQTELSRYQRYKHVFSIVILDIDNFKRVNDSYGHGVGDEVIKRVASLLTDNVRDNDVVGRWGGEEFLILCPETTLQGAFTLADHLRQEIRRTDFAVDTMAITASFGVTDYRDDESIEECIKRADQALYHAKQGGRDKTVVF
jgi:polar amino acid transport system substrate-binding protein